MFQSPPTMTGMTRALRLAGVEPQALQLAGHVARVLPQPVAALGLALLVISTALSTDATDAGGRAAEKIRDRARCLMKSMTRSSPAMKPPTSRRRLGERAHHEVDPVLRGRSAQRCRDRARP